MIKPITILAALTVLATVLAAIQMLPYRTDSNAQYLAYLKTKEAERAALPAASVPPPTRHRWSGRLTTDEQRENIRLDCAGRGCEVNTRERDQEEAALFPFKR